MNQLEIYYGDPVDRWELLLTSTPRPEVEGSKIEVIAHFLEPRTFAIVMALVTIDSKEYLEIYTDTDDIAARVPLELVKELLS